MDDLGNEAAEDFDESAGVIALDGMARVIHLGPAPVGAVSDPEFGFETYRVIYGPAHWVLDWALTSVLAGGEPIRFDCLDIVTLTRAGLVDRKDTFVDMVQLNAALGTNP